MKDRQHDKERQRDGEGRIEILRREGEREKGRQADRQTDIGRGRQRTGKLL